MATDLGKDSIGKLLLKIAIPSILAQLINALYNIVDRMYIGHIESVGKDALTGVGLTFPILMIIAAFSCFVGMGGAPRAAIKMGENDNDAAENILGNCFVSLMIISVILTTVFLLFGENLLYLFGASEKTIKYSLDYMNIYVCGTIFVQLSMGLNSFISTQGFAKMSMATILIGAVLNIVLDPIFIFTFNMGVKGAATATIISQAVSSLWVLKFLFSKNSKIRIKPKYFKINLKVLIPVFALGLSPFIMQSTESLVNAVLNSSLYKYGGDDAVGAMTIIGSVLQFIMMPLSGLAASAQPITSYNFGARQNDRVKLTFKYLFISAVTFATVVWAIVMLFPQVFIRIFTDEIALFDITKWGMRIFLSGIFMMGAQSSCQHTFVALGQAKISLTLALLRKIVLLIPLVYIMPLFLENKLMAVFIAEPIADVVASISTMIVFKLNFNKILQKGPQATKN